MRMQFEATIHDDRVSCREGTFDTTHVEDDWADIVVVAQAWHWCPDFEQALQEIARVLKPDGIAVLIWNLEDLGTKWVARNRELYEQYEGGTPQFRLGLWRRMFETRAFKELFNPQEEREVTWIFPVDLEGAVNRVFTKSYIAILPDEEKAQLRDEISANVHHGEGRKWIDQSRGIFEYPHKNLVVIVRRKN